MASDDVLALATIQRHRDLVRLRLLKVASALQNRALLHDHSKLTEEQLPGFCRINRIAREHPYPSAEYKRSLQAERETIQRHTEGEPHHPEYWLRRSDGTTPMGTFLDIIEMVCDWHGAAAAYGNGEVDIEGQIRRFNFTEHQQWMIWQVDQFLKGGAE